MNESTSKSIDEDVAEFTDELADEALDRVVSAAGTITGVTVSCRRQ